MIWELVVVYNKTIQNELSLKMFAYKYASNMLEFKPIEGISGKILNLKRSPETIVNELVSKLNGSYHVYSNDTELKDIFVIDNRVVDRLEWVNKFFKNGGGL